MVNLKKLGALFSAATAGLFGFSGSAFSASDYRDSISGADVIALQNRYGLVSTYVNSEQHPNVATTPVIVSKASSGLQFIAFLGNCDDVVLGTGCKNLVVITILNPSGLTLGDINALNDENLVARAYVGGEPPMLIFEMHAIAAGGVRLDNLDNYLNYYYTELRDFFKSSNELPAGAASVSFQKFDDRAQTSIAGQADGAGAPLFPDAPFDISDLVRDVAISNQWSMSPPAVSDKHEKH